MPGKTPKTSRPEQGEHNQAGLERLILFSDAVFAIAITLLSLEIRLPATEGTPTNAEMVRLLISIWPKYLAFIVSFLVIGLFWGSHHRKFGFIQRYDRRLLMLNLLLLMVIAFIPFPTSLISEYGNRTSTIFYALVMILASLLSVGLWLYAAHDNRLIDPKISQQQRRQEVIWPLIAIGLFLLSIGLAYIDQNLARLSWMLILLTQRIYHPK